MDLIRHTILHQANSSLDKFNGSKEITDIIEKNQQKITTLIDERDLLRRENNKTQFELSRLRTELEIVQEMARNA